MVLTRGHGSYSSTYNTSGPSLIFGKLGNIPPVPGFPKLFSKLFRVQCQIEFDLRANTA